MNNILPSITHENCLTNLINVYTMPAIIQNQLYLQFRMHFHPFKLPVKIKIVLQQSPNLLNLLSMATLIKLAGEILILIPFKY